jgi:hypothetical protein
MALTSQISQPSLLQRRILRLRRDEDSNIRVGVFPKREEILVGRLGLGGVALQGRTGEAKRSSLELQEPSWKIIHQYGLWPGPLVSALSDDKPAPVAHFEDATRVRTARCQKVCPMETIFCFICTTSVFSMVVLIAEFYLRPCYVP